MKEIQETWVHGMLFLLGQFLARWRPENAYASRGFGNHDADRQCLTARGCDRLLITMSADPAPGATALLAKLRSEMTTEQQNTVDALKKACPGYAVIPAW